MKAEFGYWRPVNKFVWLRHLPEEEIILWQCSYCGWEEVGPKYDLPTECPNCDILMIWKEI